MISTKKIVDTFLTLVRLNAPSGREREVANYIKNRMDALNLSCYEDDAAKKFGGNSGNLICFFPGILKDVPPILLVAHMDSIEPTEGIAPVIEDGIIKTDGKTILAADDRVGVAALLEAITSIVENKIPVGPLFLVFTVAEEIGMFGSKSLKKEKLPVEYSFVLDSSAKPGEIIISAPSSHSFEIRIIGKAAHAAVQPENGVDAIKIASEALTKIEKGRVSPTCTINFGVIKGGKAINIVADEVIIQGDVRSIHEDESLNWQGKIKDVFTETAEKYSGKCKIKITEKYKAFNMNENEPIVQIAKKSLENIGLEPRCRQYPGGSDANVLNSLGIPSLNFGLGYRNVHSKSEYVSLENLVFSAKIALSLCKTTASLKTQKKVLLGSHNNNLK